MGLFDGAIGSIGSSLIGGGLSFLGQSSANSANMDLARMNFQAASENRDWQERMDNTKYQRGVKDLEAAGLNPMLAYHGMTGSTPSGAVGSSGQTMHNTLAQAGQHVGDAVGKGAETAIKYAQIKNLDETNKQIQANTAQSEAATKREDSTTTLNNATALKVAQDVVQSVAMTEYYKNLAKTTSAHGAYLGAQTEGQRYHNVGLGAESRMYDRPGGEAIPYVKQVLPAVSSAVGGSILGSMLGGSIKFGRKSK